MTSQIPLPSSDQTVSVKIIDTTTFMRVPVAAFNTDKIHGLDFFEAPSYAFLLEHSSGKKLVFDLGLRKDLDGFSPAGQEPLKQLLEAGAEARAEKNVAEILQENGVKPAEIDAVVVSHWHPDHIGDPSTFPSSTALVVGPGFQKMLMPGYPADPDSLLLEADYKDRELIEIDFEKHPRPLKIGRYQAVDYFGDGSFYILDSPGHTWGHITGLARTTADTFILMGADTAHHPGAMRPSSLYPLPVSLSPSPYSNPPWEPHSFCPGELLAAIHPQHAQDQPFYTKFAEGGPDRDIPLVEESVGKMIELDGRDDVFLVIAHDKSLEGRVNFFPEEANEWRRKGWKEDTRWKFLEDFQEAAKEASK